LGRIEWALARIGTGVPHLHMEDGFGPEERSRQIPRRVLARRLLLRRATVVVPSRLLCARHREMGLPPSRLRLLPNGRRPGALRRPAAPGRGGPVVIGTVAPARGEEPRPADPRHGAAAAECRLVIVGDGAERPASKPSPPARASPAGRLRGAPQGSGGALCRLDIFALSPTPSRCRCRCWRPWRRAAGGGTDVGDIAEMLDPQNRPSWCAATMRRWPRAGCAAVDARRGSASARPIAAAPGPLRGG